MLTNALSRSNTIRFVVKRKQPGGYSIAVHERIVDAIELDPNSWARERM